MNTAVARKLESVRQKGALRNIDVAQILNTRPETVSRWTQGHAYPHRSKEKVLLELEYIVDQLSELYEPNEARQWLFSRQILLGDESPASLIQHGEIDRVLGFVKKLRDTVFL